MSALLCSKDLPSTHFFLWIFLMDALKEFIQKILLKTFYRKGKKKLILYINFLQFFFLNYIFLIKVVSIFLKNNLLTNDLRALLTRPFLYIECHTI